MIPRATRMGIATSRSLGNCRANTTPARAQKKPPMALTRGAPMRSADQPAIKLPNGAIPTSIIEKRLMTRPRILSSESDCNAVLHPATSTIQAQPTTPRIISDTAKTDEKLKTIKPMPNVSAATTIMRPEPQDL